MRRQRMLRYEARSVTKLTLYVCCVWERLCSALLAREAAHCVDEPQWLALAAASLAVHPAEPVPPLLSVPVRRSGGRQRRAALGEIMGRFYPLIERENKTCGEPTFSKRVE